MMATNVATALEIEGRDHIGRATVTLLRMNRDGAPNYGRRAKFAMMAQPATISSSA